MSGTIDNPEGGGFVPYDYRKESFRRWVDKVDKELLMLHIDMQRLAKNVKSQSHSGGPKDDSGSGGPKEPDEPPQGKSGEYADGHFYADVEPPSEEDKSGFGTEDFVAATYSIHEATHAMRGYLMLVDQMGLSRDQKKMIRDLEYAMMMISKITMAMNILMSLESKVAEGGALAAPEIFLPLMVAGGLGSASIAYGMKLNGGQI